MEELKNRLREAIERKGITASELSQISGVGKSDISNYLNGKYAPKQDKCYMLAEALNVDPGWLMTGIKQITEETIIIPKTTEARTLAKGIDKMSKEQREAILNMMNGLYPGLFTEKYVEDNHDRP